MKRLFTLASFVMGMALFIGATFLDVGCTPDKTSNDASTNDAANNDSPAPTDTSQPTDQAATPDKAPPAPDEASPDRQPPQDQATEQPTEQPATPDQTPPKPDEGTPEQSPPEPTSETPAGDQPSTGGITVSGTVGAPKFSGGLDPLADVDVCVYEKPAITCVKSDSAGKFSLPGVPANAETGLVLSKAAHVPFILTIATEMTDMTIGSTLAVTPKSTLDGLSFLLGVTIDYSKGLIAGSVMDAAGVGLPDATVTMTPASGDGPFYMNDSGIPDKNAKSTKKPGLYISANVTPGATVEITVTHATNKKCTSDAWKGATAGAAKIPVVAGHMVAAGISCIP